MSLIYFHILYAFAYISRTMDKAYSTVLSIIYFKAHADENNAFPMAYATRTHSIYARAQLLYTVNTHQSTFNANLMTICFLELMTNAIMTRSFFRRFIFPLQPVPPYQNWTVSELHLKHTHGVDTCTQTETRKHLRNER